jgi:hypothetical protein
MLAKPCDVVISETGHGGRHGKAMNSKSKVLYSCDGLECTLQQALSPSMADRRTDRRAEVERMNHPPPSLYTPTQNKPSITRNLKFRKEGKGTGRRKNVCIYIYTYTHIYMKGNQCTERCIV